jgi:hypothetical protein
VRLRSSVLLAAACLLVLAAVIVVVVRASRDPALPRQAERSSSASSSPSHSESSRSDAVGALSTTEALAPRIPAATGAMTVPAAVVSADSTPGGRYPVAGRCLDSTGRAISGARVTLLWFRETPDQNGWDEIDAPPTVETGSDGRFELALLPGADNAGASIHSVALRARASGFGPAACEIKLGPDRRFDAGDVVLSHSVTLSGIVRDERGAPQGGVLVETYREGVPSDLQEEPESTTTRDDGTFDLVDANAGAVSITAHAGDSRMSPSVDFDVVPGEHRAGIALTLPLRDAPLAVTGTVTTADGTPAPEMLVLASTQDESHRRTLHARTGEHGEFRFEGGVGEVFDLRVESRENLGGHARVSNVPVGALGLQIVLEPVREVTLRLRGMDDRPIERFSWVLLEVTPEDHHTLHDDTLADHPGGEVRVSIAVDTFLLEVSSDGHATTQLGPFVTDRIGDVIDAHLSRMPSIRGVVRANGAPLANAEVSLRAVLDERDRWLEGGFDLTLRWQHGMEEVTTDRQGRFELKVLHGGRCVVRARADKLPVARSGVLDITPDSEDIDLVIDVPVRGGIEGWVHNGSGAPLAGWTVLASSGDGVDISGTTKPDGSYVLRPVAPGKWQVRASSSWKEAMRSDFGEEHYSSEWLGGVPPIRWDCEVVAGPHTRHDIVVPDESEIELRLGAPFDSGVWKPSILIACPGQRWISLRPYALVQSEGLWRATLSCSGTARLSVDGTLDLEGWSYSRTLNVLAGRNPIQVELPIGTIKGRIKGAVASKQSLCLSWEDGEAEGKVWFSTDEAGRFECRHAPAGTCVLEVPGTDGPSRHTLQVSAGGVLDVGEL